MQECFEKVGRSGITQLTMSDLVDRPEMQEIDWHNENVLAKEYTEIFLKNVTFSKLKNSEFVIHMKRCIWILRIISHCYCFNVFAIFGQKK